MRHLPQVNMKPERAQHIERRGTESDLDAGCLFLSFNLIDLICFRHQLRSTSI